MERMLYPEVDAKNLARVAHRGQTDKIGMPYFLHPVEVAENVRRLGGSTEAVQAAYLHDVIEDTDYNAQGILAWGFSPEVVEIVEALTKRKGESRAEYLNRVIAGGREAMLVKFGDMLHNSQPDRVAQLDRDTRERLREKYEQDMAVLSQLLWKYPL